MFNVFDWFDEYVDENKDIVTDVDIDKNEKRIFIFVISIVECIGMIFSKMNNSTGIEFESLHDRTLFSVSELCIEYVFNVSG